MSTTTRHPLLGIHHVTAIAGHPRANLQFYAGVLGLRLVKKTVNFDDPQTYHLYYGDAEGRPGSILTFFPWPNARPGQMGSGQTERVGFAVPRGSLDAWQERLDQHGIDNHRHQELGDDTVRFLDPDGLPLELIDSVASNGLGAPWTLDGQPAEGMAIRGIDRVTLAYRRPQASVALLTDAMGFRPLEQEGNVQRFEVGEGGPTARLHIHHRGDLELGRVAAGSVHHVAFRVADDESQAWWQRHLASHHMQVTPVLDRNYFRSVYFREPGGVLFELATDPPGFAIDEPLHALGQSLMLPSHLEGRRDKIEAVLPPLQSMPANHAQTSETS